MNSQIRSAFAIGLLLVPTYTSAADARTAGMGYAAVASADYLSAPIYNPALLASSKTNDTIGFQFTGGWGMMGNEERLSGDDNMDTFRELYEESPESITSELIDQVNHDLTEMDNKIYNIANADVAMVLALPSASVPVSLFTHARLKSVRSMVSADYVSDTAEDTMSRLEESDSASQGLIVYDFGITFAKTVDIGGESVSFGISPKFQAMATYTVFDENDEDLAEEDLDYDDYGLNMDLGAVWNRGRWQVGLAVKDMAKKKIALRKGGYFNLNPHVTLGSSYSGDNYVFAADLDLNEQKNVSYLDDETQYIRLGAEYSPLNWFHMRFGYQSDLEGSVDDMYTFGLGVSPWETVYFDLTYGAKIDSDLGVTSAQAMFDVKVMI